MEVTKQSKRNGASRFISTKADKEQISAWRSKLDRILHVFNVCSATLSLASLTGRF